MTITLAAGLPTAVGAWSLVVTPSKPFAVVFLVNPLVQLLLAWLRWSRLRLAIQRNAAATS